MCNNIPSVDDRNRERWGLLVKEQITNIGKLRTPFLEHFDIFFLLVFLFFGFWVFAHQSTVDSGGVSRVRVRGCWH